MAANPAEYKIPLVAYFKGQLKYAPPDKNLLDPSHETKACMIIGGSRVLGAPHFLCAHLGHRTCNEHFNEFL